MFRVKNLLLLGLLLCGTFLFSQATLADSAEEAAKAFHKIEAGLYDTVVAEGQATYYVFLNEQADLSAAYSMATRAERRAYVYQTLLSHARTSQADMLAFLSGRQATADVESFYSFFIGNIVEVTSGVATLEALALRGDVREIVAERFYEIPQPTAVEHSEVIEYGIDLINADDIWPTTRGAGATISSIDSGVQWDHPALINSYRGSAGNHDFAFYDPSNQCGGGPPCDNNSHGTHTMGTMVGFDGGTNEIGVAPEAEWIAVNCGTAGCPSGPAMQGAAWLIAPCADGDNPGDPSCDPNVGADVVNNSWGGGGGDPFFQAQVDAWEAAGVISIFAAGNSGPGASTILSPSDYCNTLSVGAVDSTDTIAGFSSRGPGNFAGCMDKPDVSAPGVNVRSSVPGNGYALFNGTSMAAPHVTACLGLLASIDNTFDQTDARNFLINTAADLGAAGFDNAYGYGRIDCFQAFQQLTPDFGIMVTPPTLDVCAGTDAMFTVDVGSIAGFMDPVTLSTTAPAGTFDTNPVTPGNMAMLTIDTSGYAAGMHNHTVSGTSTTGTHDDDFTLNVAAGAPGAPALMMPGDGATGVAVQPTFSWSASADATSYDLEVATDAAMSNIVYSVSGLTMTSHTANSALSGATTYYWRVTANNGCGSSMSSVWSFMTVEEFCSSPALAIPDNDPNGTSDTINITGLRALTDVNVQLDISHTWMGDLIVTLEHDDTGTAVTLFDRPGVPGSTFGCADNNLDGTADDEGNIADIENHCNGTDPWVSDSFVPTQALSAFDGEDLAGDWTLTVSDNAGGDTGTLNTWCIVPTEDATAVELQGIETRIEMGGLVFVALLSLLAVTGLVAWNRPNQA